MDHRIALKQNTPLCLWNDKGEVLRCIIEKEIGRGGSCIVYEASRETKTGDKTLYRVKEFYPYGLGIVRGENNELIPLPEAADDFLRRQEHLHLDFSRTNRLFYSGTNYASMTNQLDIFEQNGTSYILSAYSSQKTLATYRPASIKECIRLVKQVAYVLGNLHEQGFLYLDTKPDNLLIVDGLQKQIRLFDFNSLLSVEELRKPEHIHPNGTRLSYTKGFAAIELQTAKIKRLGPHTDVFGVGALLFYLLLGDTPDAPDCEQDAQYDFTKIKYDYRLCDDQLFHVLTEFFHHTLAVYYQDRYQSMKEVVEQLHFAQRYADVTIPRIYSTKIIPPKHLFGREREFAQLDALLENKDFSCLFLTGMGGIGKSTFIRGYLKSRTFDTVLYVSYKDSIEATISDDRSIEINTLRQEEERNAGAKYFDRKLQKLRELVRGTNAILVIDHFSGQADEGLRAVLATDLKVVILTRQAPSYRSSLTLHLGAISHEAALKKLFESNLGRCITEDEMAGWEDILRRVDCHTLLLELIAKQIAASRMTVSDAAAFADKYGISSIAPEKVDYERDHNVRRDTVGNIMDALFEASALSAEKKTWMKAASLLGDDGMDIREFQRIMQLPSKDDLNELIQDGWLMISGDVLSMHKVIQEAVHRWAWTPRYRKAAERFLSYFYEEIRLESTKNDCPKKMRAYLMDGKGAMLPKDKRSMIFQKLVSSKEEAPADIKKLAALLTQSEDILRECKRAPAIQKSGAYRNLLMETVLKSPPYREAYILAQADRILADPETDFAMQMHSERTDEENRGNPVAVMKLYAAAVLIHADNKRSEEAKRWLKQAKKFAEKVRHRKVYAWYFHLLSEYYDILLDGAYDTEDPYEMFLLKKMLDGIEKAMHYAKRGRSWDWDHLYIQNILAKVTVLIRSGMGRKQEIAALMEGAKKLIEENTGPYAQVRLIYYLACGWYYALIYENERAVQMFVKDALEMSEKILPTDLQRIEDVLIPCANILFELGSDSRAMALLYEGTRLCAKHANTDSYARVKQALCDHLWEVGMQAQNYGLCQKMIARIDAENREILAPENKVVIPDWVRSIIAEHTTKDCSDMRA